ncbi:hypothetical protein BC829DRAFT_297979 [Chytridium lagenaria]|nr:hypothetical protein BC829DRAFT_297979 [Chytridium lagenaria]
MSQLEVLVPVRESEARAYLGPFRRHAETSPSRPLSMPLLTLDGHATSVYDRRFSLDGHPVPLRISLHPAARHLNISVPSPPSAATSSESLGLSNTNLAPSPTPKRTHPLHPIQEKTSISSTSPSRDASHSISNVNMTPSLTLPASVPHATILEISNTFSGQALEQRGQLVPTFTPTDSISAAQFSTVIPFSMPDAALTTSSIPDCEIFSNEAAELLLMDNVLKLSNSYDGEFVTPQSDVDAESERSPVPPLRSSSKIPFVIMENTLLSEAMPAESIGSANIIEPSHPRTFFDEDALKVLAHAPAIQFQQMETEEQGPEGLLMKTLSDDTSINRLPYRRSLYQYDVIFHQLRCFKY